MSVPRMSTLLVLLVIYCLVSQSIAFSTNIVPTTTRHSPTTNSNRGGTVIVSPLFAKKKKKKQSGDGDGSRLSLSSLTGGSKGGKIIKLPSDGNSMVASIEMAQILMDKRRHDELKKELRTKYPLIPGDVIDFCMDLTADGFTSIAPKELQTALEPGGFQKMKPELRSNIVKLALQQQVIQDIPIIKEDDKRMILNSVVDLVLDNMLQDAQNVLSDPEDRLDQLRLQQEQVYKIMGTKKLMMYRIKRYPLRILLGISLASLLGYELCFNEPIIAAFVASINLTVLKCKSFILGIVTTIKRSILNTEKQIKVSWKSFIKTITKHKKKLLKTFK